MTNNIAKIRAALEMARDYITSDLASERGAFEGYEGVSRIDEIKADLASNASALAALAELEQAAAEPVAWMYDKGDEGGLVTPFNPLTTPGHGGRKNIRPLYAAPPAKPVMGMFTAEEMEAAKLAAYRAGADKAIAEMIRIS